MSSMIRLHIEQVAAIRLHIEQVAALHTAMQRENVEYAELRVGEAGRLDVKAVETVEKTRPMPLTTRKQRVEANALAGVPVS